MMVAILGVVVATIVLLLLLLLSAKTWNWVHIVFTFLVFAAAILGGLTAARNLKTRVAWMQQAERNRIIYEGKDGFGGNKEAYLEALYGPRDALDFGRQSLRGINEALSLVLIGKGRTWNNGQIQNQGNQLLATFNTGDASAPPSQLQQDMTVYAFRDEVVELGEQPVSLPVTYIGSFKVAAVNGNQVTLDPIYVAPVSAKELAVPSSSWTFYEKAPMDSRTAFKRDAGLEGDSFDLDTYRERLKTVYLPAEKMILELDADGNVVRTMDPSSGEYESLIDRHAFDGLSTGQIESWILQQSGRVQGFDPPADELRVRARVTGGNPQFTVDADGSIADGPVDPLGRVVDPALKAGGDGTVTFQQDDELIIDKPSYDGYQRSPTQSEPGVRDSYQLEQIDETYVRPLNDYAFRLAELAEQTRKISEAAGRVSANTTTTNVARDNAQGQINAKDQLILQLQENQGRYENDLQLATQLSQRLEQELQQRLQQLQTYYKQIMELHKEISQKAADAKEKADANQRHLAADQ